MDVPVLVAEELEQAAEEVGEVGDELQVGYGVEEGDPPDEELAGEGIDDPYALLQQGDEAWKREGRGQGIQVVGDELVPVVILVRG